MTPPPIPEALRKEAIILGLDEGLVDLKWAEHCEWSDRNGWTGGYGGKAWVGMVRSVVADLADRKSKDEIRAQRSARIRAEEASRRRADELSYQKGAMGLEAWLTSLAGRLGAGEVLPVHEREIAEASTYRFPDESAGFWLFEALTGKSPGPRVQNCACGAPVQSWVMMGRRYYSGTCARHQLVASAV
jgi:hypothetical protein